MVGGGFTGLAAAMYELSKAGAYFDAPQLGALERTRNLALRLTPDAAFSVMLLR
jgi:glycine/D-amino acid oxidase-like deaminating enzyme